VNVGQPEFFQAMDSMITKFPLPAWKTYVRWNIIRSSAPHLSSDFVNENFRFYGTTLQGSTELQPRWKRILQTINGLMGEALGELYVERAFSPVAKQRAREMVSNLLLAYRQRLEGNEWMDDSTKRAALKKLSTFGVKIGYPDVWKDYAALDIDRSSHMANLRRAAAFEFRRNLDRLGRPVDKNEWFMPPQTVNAYYNSSRNEIVFPAGILQPPFFDPDADDAVNYGGMGAVIGHEITHGFDDRGSQFDPDGNLRNWWTESSRTEFERRADLIVRQYSAYVVIDSLTINGKLTIGENIADLGGLTIAYTALQRALEGKPRPVIDGFTPEQRFFLAWAQIWRRTVRPEALRLQVKTDSHSPARFRVHGPLANLREFQEAFGCGEGAGFLRTANERITIW
jgi:putative endopeptidase